jgi:hypothetical protein
VTVVLSPDPTYTVGSHTVGPPSSIGTVFIADNDSANGALPVTRFAIIGDFGNNSLAESNVADLVNSWSASAVVTVGDNNYFGGDASTIDQNIGQYYQNWIYPYQGSYGPGDTVNQFWPALGNHDWGDTFPNPTGDQPYLNYFPGLPGNKRYYDITLGPLVHVFILDSDQNEPDGNTSTSVHAAWLKGRLAASPEPYKLVVFHHPPYSSESSGDIAYNMRWPFQAWGATAVLSGHAHDYQRFFEDSNFPYIVDGLGGMPPDQLGTLQPGSQIFYNGDNGAMLVEATAADITFQFITRTGKVIDTFTITNPPKVTGRSPATGAAGVSPTAPVTAQFSEAMKAASITTATFRLRAVGATSDVPAKVSYSGFTATFQPTVALAANTTYQVTVSGTVTDMSGNPLGADSVWSFTTGAGQWVQTTAADFAAGSGSGTAVTNTSGGEVQLAASSLSGIFASIVFDATRAATWGTASWTANVPAGTTLTVETRSGNTATPDSTWSAWAAVANGQAVASPAARYLQYRLKLTSTSLSLTPVLFDITFTWE